VAAWADPSVATGNAGRVPGLYSQARSTSATARRPAERKKAMSTVAVMVFPQKLTRARELTREALHA